jgi:hypothetical protein
MTVAFKLLDPALSKRMFISDFLEFPGGSWLPSTTSIND